MLQVSQLYIYPVKSMAGIAVQSTVITDRGFQYDRRWMLIDENNRFISQRENAAMALFKIELTTFGLKVFFQNDTENFLNIPFIPTTNKKTTVSIWDETCEAMLVDTAADKWFSTALQMTCRLVYMSDETIVKIDERYAINNDLTSFSDGYPILMVSEASLADLNGKLSEPLPINRFRPNLVITGSDAFIENSMQEFTINGIIFYGVKPCARCVVTTIDQQTLAKGKEPLKTLATYRSKNNKIYFGENIIAKETGEIKVGDKIVIIEMKENLFIST